MGVTWPGLCFYSLSSCIIEHGPGGAREAGKRLGRGSEVGGDRGMAWEGATADKRRSDEAWTRQEAEEQEKETIQELSQWMSAVAQHVKPLCGIPTGCQRAWIPRSASVFDPVSCYCV